MKNAKKKANFPTYEEAYTPKYCQLLELGYGTGLMSEGGEEGIERMFNGIPLKNKSAIDIGSGLGGVAFYLAGKYDMQITGIDVNQWMVNEATRRIPTNLQHKVNFLLSTSNCNWPIPEESKDIIYSKGVLAHVENKDEEFQECHRILKKGGLLVIIDWLSFEEKWGENMMELIELEHLSLYPITERKYIECLERNGFRILSVRDESDTYALYNQLIITKLKRVIKEQSYPKQFSETDINATIEGIADTNRAFEAKELREMRFVAIKD